MSHDHGTVCHCNHEEGTVCHCDHGPVLKPTLSERVKPYRLLLAAFAFVIIFAAVATIVEGYIQLHVFMQYLMAGYFLVFGVMQTISLKKSAKMLQQYDTIAKYIPFYGYIYPPLQIVLGLAYFFWISPIITNLVAATVVFFTLLGVLDVLENKKKVRCGCLGDSMKVSVSWVTLVENAVMFTMAFGMLIYFFATLAPANRDTDSGAGKTHPHRSL